MPQNDAIMDHRVFRFATRGQCIKGKKLDCFEHNHVFCFKLHCCPLMHCHLVEIERRGGPFRSPSVTFLLQICVALLPMASEATPQTENFIQIFDF